MNVELRIERLVLDRLPLPAADRAALAEAFRAELQLLVQAGGVSPTLLGGRAVPRLTAPLAPAASTAAVAPLGREIARSVYSCLGG